MRHNQLIELINTEVAAHRSELIALREDLHRIPELAFLEVRTAAYLKTYLSQLSGVKLTAIGETGLMAEFSGKQAGPCLALRADMDGLLVEEETGLAFASEHHGYMHACGHDGHMAALLITAKILSQQLQHVSGRVRLLFQPAEEIGEGATAFIQAGVLEGVDRLFGLHLWAPLSEETVGVNQGALMAAGDFFEIVIQGKGGHGAMPHDLIDPIVMGAELISGLQTIISRHLPPTTAGVVSVTRVTSGNSYNVIPETMTLGGTLRALSLADLTMIYAKIESLSHDICHAYGGEAQVRFFSRPNAYPLINDQCFAREVKQALREGLPEKTCGEVTPTMAGDDFSQYLKTGVPSCYIFIGSGGPTTAYPHHHPKFNVSNESLVTATKAYLHVIRRENMEEEV